MYEPEHIYRTPLTTVTTVGFLPKVYGWMTGGLALTALMSLYTLSSNGLLDLVIGNRIVFYGLIIGELGLVVVLSAAINRISAMAATLMFMLYSALNGVTFASIFLLYTSNSIASTFMIASGTSRS